MCIYSFLLMSWPPFLVLLFHCVCYLFLQRAALRYIPETVGWPTLGVIAAMAAVSVLAAMFLSRKS